MKFATGWTRALISVSMLMAAGSAHAAPLTFDCDAPASNYSPLGNLAQAAPAISGIITPKRAREGRLLPTVGAQLNSPDGKSTAGFLLTLPSPNSQEMDITLVTNRQGEQSSGKVGTVSVNAPIPFRLFVDNQGSVSVLIGEQSWTSPFMRLIGGKEQVFCSAGQFEISELRFSD